MVPLADRSTNDVMMTINPDETSNLDSLVVGNALGKDQDTGSRPVTLGEPFFGNPELGQKEFGKDQNTGLRPVTLGKPFFGNPELGQNMNARQLRRYVINADPPQIWLDDTWLSVIRSDTAQGKKDAGRISPPCSTFFGIEEDFRSEVFLNYEN